MGRFYNNVNIYRTISEHQATYLKVFFFPSTLSQKNLWISPSKVSFMNRGVMSHSFSLLSVSKSFWSSSIVTVFLLVWACFNFWTMWSSQITLLTRSISLSASPIAVWLACRAYLMWGGTNASIGVLYIGAFFCGTKVLLTSNQSEPSIFARVLTSSFPIGLLVFKRPKVHNSTKYLWSSTYDRSTCLPPGLSWSMS